MADLALLQLPRTAQASIIAAFATVGVEVRIVDNSKQVTRAERHALPVAMVLRDPISRIKSHFNSRLRSGRPYHQEIWTDWEAGLFTVLPTFNAWGEAIVSQNEFLRSAADRAYVYWMRHFPSLETIVSNRWTAGATIAGDVADLPTAVRRLAAFVGCDVPQLPDDPAIIDPTPDSLRAELTELAALGFRNQFAKEIELYERLLGRVK